MSRSNLICAVTITALMVLMQAEAAADIILHAFAQANTEVTQGEYSTSATSDPRYFPGQQSEASAVARSEFNSLNGIDVLRLGVSSRNYNAPGEFANGTAFAIASWSDRFNIYTTDFQPTLIRIHYSIHGEMMVLPALTGYRGAIVQVSSTGSFSTPSGGYLSEDYLSWEERPSGTSITTTYSPDSLTPIVGGGISLNALSYFDVSISYEGSVGYHNLGVGLRGTTQQTAADGELLLKFGDTLRFVAATLTDGSPLSSRGITFDFNSQITAVPEPISGCSFGVLLYYLTCIRRRR